MLIQDRDIVSKAVQAFNRELPEECAFISQSMRCTAGRAAQPAAQCSLYNEMMGGSVRNAVGLASVLMVEPDRLLERTHSKSLIQRAMRETNSGSCRAYVPARLTPMPHSFRKLTIINADFHANARTSRIGTSST